MITLKKNYASLKSAAGNLYEMTDDDIAKMHEVLLKMYDDLFQYCQRHSLKLIAGGGTALGAFRHQGFIPWDDDMDLGLIRDDYRIFLRYFHSEMGGKYDLLAPGSPEGCSCFLMRVMKKNTTLLNMIDEAAPYPTGIYIDITPIDYAPNGKLERLIKGTVSDILRFIAYSVYWKQYRSASLREFMLNSEGRNYYKLRILTGSIFSFFSAEKWFLIFDRFIRGKESAFLTVAAGRRKYVGEVFPKDVFFPLKKGVFEGRTIYVYRQMHEYLERLYGDYMKIPDVRDRERHLCLKLSFTQSREETD